MSNLDDAQDNGPELETVRVTGHQKARRGAGSYSEKRIRITIRLQADGDFFNFDGKGDANNTLVFDGLRTSCQIGYGNGNVMPTARIRIYGLRLENMAKLLRVQWNTAQALQNVIQVEAGDARQMSIVFAGNITFAKPDFAAAPNVALVIESSTGVYHQLAAVPPRSFAGEVDVAQAIGALAQDMGFLFENNGVSTTVSNPYMPQTAMQQVRELAADGGAALYIEQNTIAIAPRGQPRRTHTPVIRPQSGLIGYPVPDLIGVRFSCLFQPALRFGGRVEIADSLIAQCNGKWRIFGMDLLLESQTPAGKWQADIRASRIGEDGGQENTHVAS